MKIKYIYIGLVSLLLFWLLFRFLFCYTIISFGEFYKHKLFSVDDFPVCLINPLKNVELHQKIENYILGEKYEEYYEERFRKSESKGKSHFPAFKRQMIKFGFRIISIRQLENMEVLIFTDNPEYISLVIKIDTVTNEIIGYY